MQLNETQKRLHTKIKSELGKEVMRALEDDSVIEIMLNSDNTLWVERIGHGMEHIIKHTCSAQAFIHTVASYHNTNITIDNPVLECELPLCGSRLEALVPPLVKYPSFTIRKKAKTIFTLDDYERQGILAQCDKNYNRSEEYIPDNLTKKEIIKYAVEKRKNILVVGSTGSGKTTLTNAIIDEIAKVNPDDRLIIIEDTAELQCTSKNQIIMRAKRENQNMDLLRLLMVTMRLRPDRILIGEVRDKAALELLKSWNTGHPGGVATVHADSARLGLLRIEQLISEATTSPMQTLIAEAINLVIFITKIDGGRIVPEIMEVRGYDPITQQYITKIFK